MDGTPKKEEQGSEKRKLSVDTDEANKRAKPEFGSPRSSTPTRASTPGSTSVSTPVGKNNKKYIKLTSFVVGNPGKKRYQQDMPIIVPDMAVVNKELKDTRYAYVGVYDGHGGSFCSEYLRMNLHVALANTLAPQVKLLDSGKQTPTKDQLKAQQQIIQTAFIESFKQLDKTLCGECVSRKSEDGSCCIAAMIRGDVVWVANVGDSKAVLGRRKTDKEGKETVKATALSKDHSPLLVKERERIQKAGGKVEDGRVDGRLGVSRSFGDTVVKRKGVTARPDITKFTITPADQFMILACDGLWEVFSIQDAVDYVRKAIAEQWELRKSEPEPPQSSMQALARERKETATQLVCRRVTEKLVREAVLLRGAKDNVTAIVTLFADGIRDQTPIVL